MDHNTIRPGQSRSSQQAAQVQAAIEPPGARQPGPVYCIYEETFHAAARLESALDDLEGIIAPILTPKDEKVPGPKDGDQAVVSSHSNIWWKLEELRIKINAATDRVHNINKTCEL